MDKFQDICFPCLGLYLFSGMDKGLDSDLQLMNHGAPPPPRPYTHTHCRGEGVTALKGKEEIGPKSDRGSVLLYSS